MAEPPRLWFEGAETPLGRLLVVTDDADHLHAVDWDDHAVRMRAMLDRRYGLGYALTARAEPSVPMAALLAYFAGDLRAIDPLPTAARGTAFQRRVWCALRDIAVGETTSYGALARRIGCPDAVRAVGLANGANPVGIVVPCHRVIGADGSLTGYGGGIERKRWLLAHEGVGTLL